MKAYEVIGAAVRERGIPCTELARRTNISAELLRRSLNGERKITADEFVSLCAELNLTLDDFKAMA